MSQREKTALELLDEICAEPIETGPVQLSQEYLDAVERVERLPSNQDGADKSRLWEAIERDRRHFAAARMRAGRG